MSRLWAVGHPIRFLGPKGLFVMGFSPQTEVGTTLAFNSRDFTSTVRHPNCNTTLAALNDNPQVVVLVPTRRRMPVQQVEETALINFFRD